MTMTSVKILDEERIANLSDIQRNLMHRVSLKLDDNECAQMFRTKTPNIIQAIERAASALGVPKGSYEERRRMVYLMARRYFSKGTTGITQEEKDELAKLRAVAEEAWLEEATRPDPPRPTVVVPPSVQRVVLPPAAVVSPPVPKPIPPPIVVSAPPLPPKPPQPVVVERAEKKEEVSASLRRKSYIPQPLSKVRRERKRQALPIPPPTPVAAPVARQVMKTAVKVSLTLAEQITKLCSADKRWLKDAVAYRGSRGNKRDSRGFYDLPLLPRRIKKQLTLLPAVIPGLYLRRALRELARRP
ncbi:MAG: hypothetical protein V4436_02980 [Patescibacteria group bacterium]